MWLMNAYELGRGIMFNNNNSVNFKKLVATLRGSRPGCNPHRLL